MPNTEFIALQCCQCSMMQVKQKKKSNNKWTCSVCNQKQSMRKVFARGYMAKDLRQFVQSFNLSQKGQTPELEEGIESEMPTKKPKLNTSGGGGGGRGSESDSGDGIRKITLGDEESMASPPTMIKTASKWNKYMSRDDMEPKTTCLRPASKWLEYMTTEDDHEQRTHRPTMATGASKCNNNLTQDGMEPKSCQEKLNKPSCKTGGSGVGKRRTQRPTLVKRSASKWNCYLTKEEEEEEEEEDYDRKFADHKGVLETIIHDDQKVEDDIHPDFI